MGRTKTAYLMAVRGITAQLESELRLAEAGKEDVSDIFAEQQEKIFEAIETLQKTGNGGPIYYTEGQPTEKKPVNYIPFVVIALVVILWLNL